MPPAFPARLSHSRQVSQEYFLLRCSSWGSKRCLHLNPNYVTGTGICALCNDRRLL